MTHGLGFQALRWSQYGHTLKMHLILEKKMTYLRPQQREINVMHGYDVLKSLYLNCKIHYPWVRGSGP